MTEAPESANRTPPVTRGVTRGVTSGVARGRAAWLRRNAPLLLGVALSVLALVQSHHYAQKGRGAFLRWEGDFTALWSGGELYSTGPEEGYPTLPVTLVLMTPFNALGPIVGSVAWAAFKIGLAWWLLSRAMALAAGRPRSLPVWAQLAILLLSFRPMLSDILHGNINLVVGATVASAAWSWSRGRSLAAGVWLGLGAALKVTPALGLLLFLAKRNVRGVSGFALGLAAGALGPALWLGLGRTIELDHGWWQQMVQPYIGGSELTLMQTHHINQSLLGVLSRYFTDGVAIAADPPGFPQDVRISWLVLEPGVFRAVHLGACLAVLALLGLCLVRGRDERRGPFVLAEFSLLVLAMLMLSERSWKHHHVMLAFPLAFLVLQVVRRRDPGVDPAAAPLAASGLIASVLFHGATGSGVLGSEGSDLAEAYGVYLAGNLALLISVGACLWRMHGRAAEGAPVA